MRRMRLHCCAGRKKVSASFRRLRGSEVLTDRTQCGYSEVKSQGSTAERSHAWERSNCRDNQANTKYLRTVSTTSQVPVIPGSTTKMSPALRWMGSMPSGVMMQ